MRKEGEGRKWEVLKYKRQPEPTHAMEEAECEKMVRQEARQAKLS